ncbi:MAG: formyl transferase [Allorhizobium sp.]
MAASTIVIMTAGGANPAIVINALAKCFPDLTVVVEAAESKLKIWQRRARRLGPISATGQLATMVAGRLLKSAAARRAAEIIAEYDVSTELSPSIPLHHVGSLNDPDCRAYVRSLEPSVVLTISSRLLSRATLADMPCPVINLHAGINPAYRGQMGAYWSLIENDAANFGATVHMVDAGTDTGGTLYEVRATPSPRDFISTYPLLLTAASTGIVIKAVEDALAGTLAPRPPEGRSLLRFPPTIWRWIWNGIARGIW